MVPSSREDYSCFEDQTAPHLVRQLQSFNDHQSNNPTEIYNLTTSMEMINFPQTSKNLDTNSVFWKGFSGDAGGSSSSSKALVSINEPTTTSHDIYHQQQDEFNTKASFGNESNFMLMDDQNDPANMRSCHVFLCGANERPSQGLSLSLSSNNPSSIGLQSFQLRHQEHDQAGNDHMRFDHEFLGPKSVQHHHQQQVMQDGYLEKVAPTNILQYQHQQQGGHQFQIRSSKYLGPAQQLLNEFCNLGTSRNGHDHHHESKMQKTQKLNQWNQVDDENIGTSSSLNKHSLYSLEFLELQKRKTKLLQMLEEVDRRYKHYCDQMKAVVSSFEAVAGNGTATVYSALASKTMSKHFRCLRDGIVGQIKATKKAMGEKETAPPGGTRGETPRLRVLDQTLRQQRAFQQMNMMETHPWRPQRGLPERSVSVLRAWLFEHFLHPVRLWKPMVEEMYVEETKEHENNMHGNADSPDHGVPNLDPHDNNDLINDMNPHNEDHKPTQDQLVRIDSECLSSIINHPERNEAKHIQDHLHQHHQQQFGRISDTFGAVELDFSAYNHQNNFTNASGGNGGGVSLTLGLQQHGGLAFSPTSQSSLYYPREQIENCQQVQVQYSSLLDAGETQNLPYRNLMGAQLLHDLAG
uniref:POX domain-containing protein n=1 Tax=Daucus carota subsp. sativus TaxID=79200 RepID=A0A166F9Y2_DAUCS